MAEIPDYIRRRVLNLRRLRAEELLVDPIEAFGGATIAEQLDEPDGLQHVIDFLIREECTFGLRVGFHSSVQPLDAFEWKEQDEWPDPETLAVDEVQTWFRARGAELIFSSGFDPDEPEASIALWWSGTAPDDIVWRYSGGPTYLAAALDAKARFEEEQCGVERPNDE